MDRDNLIEAVLERGRAQDPTVSEAELREAISQLSNDELQGLLNVRDPVFIDHVSGLVETQMVREQIVEQWLSNRENPTAAAERALRQTMSTMDQGQLTLIRDSGNIERMARDESWRTYMNARGRNPARNIDPSTSPWYNLDPETNRPYPETVTVPGVGEMSRRDWVRQQLTGGFSATSLGMIIQSTGEAFDVPLTPEDFVLGPEEAQPPPSRVRETPLSGRYRGPGFIGQGPPPEPPLATAPMGLRYRGQGLAPGEELERYRRQTHHIANTMTPWEMQDYLLSMSRDDLMVWQARAEQLGFMDGTPAWGIADAGTVEAFDAMIQTWAVDPTQPTLEEFMSNRQDFWFQANRGTIEESQASRERQRTQIRNAAGSRTAVVTLTSDEELNATLEDVSRTLFGMGRGILSDEERAAITAEIRDRERAAQTAGLDDTNRDTDRQLATMDAEADAFVQALLYGQYEPGELAAAGFNPIHGNLMPAREYQQWATWLGLDPNDRSVDNQVAIARAAAQAMFDTYGSWSDVAQHWVVQNWADQRNDLTPNSSGPGQPRLREQAHELYQRFRQREMQRNAEIEAEFGEPGGTRIVETETVDAELLMAQRAAALHPDIYGGHALGVAAQTWINMLTEGR